MNEIPTYSIIKNGGRIKSAGASYDFVEKAGSDFNSSPTAAQASETVKIFSEARNNPPQNVRDRFFPRDMKSVDLKGSPALFRAVLKTDQGAGKFLPFTTGETQGAGNIQHHVGIEGGYVIPEAYLMSQLTNADNKLKGLTDLLANQFQGGQLSDSRKTLQELRLLCEQAGIEFSRRAGVGRDGFMFIHPYMTVFHIIDQ